MKKLVLSIACCLQAVFVFSQIYFSNTALQLGINHTYLGASGGGVSFYDFDQDGLDDITLATGQNETIHFYKNTGGSFQKLPPLVPHLEQAKQILWADFDNDGDKDLFVATFNGANRLYKNTGNLIFIDITMAAGLPPVGYQTFGACWADYNRDGWLDLYYGERKFGQTGLPNENRLFRNNSDGTFTEVTLESGANDAGKIPFCSAFLDFNNDNWPDIYTANDKLSGNTLLQNNGDGTFSDVSVTTGAGLVMDAMCVTVGDYDNDGWQDIYITDIENGNEFLHNLGANNMQVVFEEVAEETGTGFYGIGWGSSFLDAENDGDLDLYVSGMLTGSGVVSSAFYRNDGTGTFSQPPAGFLGDTVSSFNNAVGDFNNDGFADIMVINTMPFKSQLWKNAGGNLNWLKMDLQGVFSNRDAIGARIEVYAEGTYQMRYRQCGTGFLGQNSGTEIIGLGSFEKADSIVITWPTGHVDRLFDVMSHQKIFVAEGSTTNGEIHVDEDVTLAVTNAVITEKPFGITIAPNPVQNIMRVTLTEERFSRYAILTPGGHTLLTGRINKKDFQLDTTGIPSGVFFLMMWNKSGEKGVWQLIKH